MPDRARAEPIASETMPVLTLWQPWASLIAFGVKTIETRGWPTAYRGPIAIHAAARPLSERLVLGDYEVWPADPPGRPHPNHPEGRPARLYRNTDSIMTAGRWWPLPFGAVVATAELIEVLPIVAEDACCWDECRHPNAHAALDGQVIWHHEGRYHTTVVVEQAYGDYTPGRFAWVLAGVEKLSEPVPFKGGQGLSRRIALDDLVVPA